MANIYYEQHGDLTLLKGKRVAIVGYGSQGHAHALNLRDSGVDVMVACYPASPSAERAKAAGLTIRTVEEAAKLADFVVMLIPDQTQKKVYQESIAPHLHSGQTLMFAHGFNIHFGQVVPPASVDVSMIAPKGPGHRVRELYVEEIQCKTILNRSTMPFADYTLNAYLGCAFACSYCYVPAMRMRHGDLTPRLGKRVRDLRNGFAIDKTNQEP